MSTLSPLGLGDELERAERQAEREMDRLDRELLSGRLTQGQYERFVRNLDSRMRKAGLR